MKNAMVSVLVVAGLVYTVWPRSRGGPRTGEWHGVTTQGLPIEFVVVDTDDGLTIQNWRVRVDLRCEVTGRRVHGAVGGGVPIPLRDGQFLAEIANLGLWHRWTGSFSDSEARGQVESIWPALTGTVRSKLGTEKCFVPELGWKARNGESAVASAEVPPEVTIDIEKNGIFLSAR